MNLPPVRSDAEPVALQRGDGTAIALLISASRVERGDMACLIKA
jgi:hypothetical protein